MGVSYVKSDEKRKLLSIDAKNLYGGCALSEYLPYDQRKFDRNVKLEDTLNTDGDSDFGYFNEVNFKYPDNTKQKPKLFPFAPENKKTASDKFTPFMNEDKPNISTNNREKM